jgi:hypothetical protein
MKKVGVHLYCFLGPTVSAPQPMTARKLAECHVRVKQIDDLYKYGLLLTPHHLVKPILLFQSNYTLSKVSLSLSPQSHSNWCVSLLFPHFLSL